MSCAAPEFGLFDAGEQLVSTIGRYECIEEDFKRICDRIGIAGELPHLNASEHDHYSTYFKGQERKAVRQAHRWDIQRFGYTFDG